VTETFFVGLIDVPKAGAWGSFEALRRATQFQNLLAEEVLQKCVGLTCDGASVNTGAENGVIAIMHRDVSDRIVMVHCLVHRLELAYEKTMKNNKMFDKIITMLQEPFTMYHRSAQQSANLCTTFRPWSWIERIHSGLEAPVGYLIQRPPWQILVRCWTKAGFEKFNVCLQASIWNEQTLYSFRPTVTGGRMSPLATCWCAPVNRAAQQRTRTWVRSSLPSSFGVQAGIRP